MCNYQPEIEERHPVIKEILAKPTEQWSALDAGLIKLENERLQEIKDTLEEFIAWREKMGTMMDQAVGAAQVGGVFYHPCTGCPEWE